VFWGEGTMKEREKPSSNYEETVKNLVFGINPKGNRVVQSASLQSNIIKKYNYVNLFKKL
jgi:hypothetical protein